jgi:integrase
MRLRLRGRVYHVDFARDHLRLRGTLGTRSKETALKLVHRLETAVSEGPRSKLWTELSTSMPRRTFRSFAALFRVKEKVVVLWNQLRTKFEEDQRRRLAIEEIKLITVQTYPPIMDKFQAFLAEVNVEQLDDIDRKVVQNFWAWRVPIMQRHEGSRGVPMTDAKRLHRVFQFAVEEGYISVNPVIMRGIPEYAGGGAQPFSANELVKLEAHVGEECLLFLLPRWTGLRRADLIKLSWAEVDLQELKIEHRAQKNGGKIVLPIFENLLLALTAEYERRKPQRQDPVLLTPKGGWYSGTNLYWRLKRLGVRAGVHVSPHRFRDTFAVDMLLRGLDVSYVAQMLGDTVAVLMTYYVPFVRELRERARLTVNNGVGIEQFVTEVTQQV